MHHNTYTIFGEAAYYGSCALMKFGVLRQISACCRECAVHCNILCYLEIA